MQQTLRVYRYHSRQCNKGYTKLIYDRLEDCSCPLDVIGYLRNHLDSKGKPKRIKHHSLETSDPRAANEKRSQMLTWGQLTAPATGLEALQGASVTVKDAVDFFYECGAASGTKGKGVKRKYKQLLQNRLLPWCESKSIRLIKPFDEMSVCRAFFNTWKQQKNVDNERILEVNTDLGQTTKRAMMERYRSFLGFCKENGWLLHNHAKKIKVATKDIPQKYAWTLDEYDNIVSTLKHWTDEYGRQGQPEAIRLYAYAMALRYSGQRISDVSMFGPDTLVQDHNGCWFFALTQIKTGQFVKIPVEMDLVRQLQALPLRGELDPRGSGKTGQ